MFKKIFFALLVFSSSAFSATSYDGIQSFIRDLASQYPETSTLFSIGTNDQGTSIEGLKIGNGEAKYLIVGTHHGDELGATEVTKAMATHLADQPIEGRTIYVIPVLNVTGYNSVNRFEEDAGGNGWDPNRDYANPCKSQTSQLWRLTSTQLLAKFIDQENIIGDLSLHNEGDQIGFAWITAKGSYTPDNQIFSNIAIAGATLNKYAYGTYPDMAYSAYGTLEDYAYWKHGVWSFVVELGHAGHQPPATSIAEDIRLNIPAMRAMILAMPTERSSAHEFNGSCSDRLMPTSSEDIGIE